MVYLFYQSGHGFFAQQCGPCPDLLRRGISPRLLSSRTAGRAGSSGSVRLSLPPMWSGRAAGNAGAGLSFSSETGSRSNVAWNDRGRPARTHGEAGLSRTPSSSLMAALRGWEPFARTRYPDSQEVPCEATGLPCRGHEPRSRLVVALQHHGELMATWNRVVVWICPERDFLSREYKYLLRGKADSLEIIQNAAGLA